MEIVELKKPRRKTERDEGWMDVEMAKRCVLDRNKLSPIFPMLATTT
jgi:hypothetical protein